MCISILIPTLTSIFFILMATVVAYEVLAQIKDAFEGVYYPTLIKMWELQDELHVRWFEWKTQLDAFGLNSSIEWDEYVQWRGAKAEAYEAITTPPTPPKPDIIWLPQYEVPEPSMHMLGMMGLRQQQLQYH